MVRVIFKTWWGSPAIFDPQSISGILRDKTMDDKFMSILDNDKQNYALRRLILLVQKFVYYRFIARSRFNKSTQSFKLNKIANVFLKLWVTAHSRPPPLLSN